MVATYVGPIRIQGRYLAYINYETNYPTMRINLWLVCQYKVLFKPPAKVTVKGDY